MSLSTSALPSTATMAHYVWGENVLDKHIRNLQNFNH